MWNFFEFKRVLDRDEELLNDQKELDEVRQPWMGGGTYADYLAMKGKAAPATAKPAVSQPTVSQPAAAPAVSVAPPVEKPPSVPTTSEPSGKTPLTRTTIPRTGTPPTEAPTEAPAATPPTEEPAPGKPSLPRTTIPRTPVEPEPGASTERPGADPQERLSGSRDLRKKLEGGGEDRLSLLNNLIKGAGDMRLYAMKMMDKLGIKYNPEQNFQISAGGMPEEQLQFYTPTGPQVAQEIVVQDRTTLNKLINGTLLAGKRDKTEPEVQKVAVIKNTLGKMDLSPQVARAIRFERFLNVDKLAGLSSSIRQLSEQLSKLDRLYPAREDRGRSRIPKENPQLDLEATQELLRVSTRIDYPWVHVEGDINDPESTVTLDDIPEFDREEIEALGIRYPSIPWLNVQQGIDPKAPMGGMKPGEPTPEAPRQKMPAQDRITAAIDRFASYADRESVKIPDDPATREKFFDVDIPKMYKAIYGTIQKYYDNGQIDDATVERLFQKVDAIKDQLADQWKIDFDSKPDVKEAHQMRESAQWVNYYTLMEYYK
jgi:hypothetical protein